MIFLGVIKYLVTINNVGFESQLSKKIKKMSKHQKVQLNVEHYDRLVVKLKHGSNIIPMDENGLSDPVSFLQNI